MDGRGSLRKEKIREWSREAWQAIALFTASALVLTNAAWYYTAQTIREEQLQSRNTISAAEPLAIDAEPLRVQETQRPVGRDRPLDENERCINGQRFRHIKNGWLQSGTC
jgi:hypothetical protein